MSTEQRPTHKMAETAAAIRRAQRGGIDEAKLALLCGLPQTVIARVVKARTINGASAVFLDNALQNVTHDDTQYMTEKR